MHVSSRLLKAFSSKMQLPSLEELFESFLPRNTRQRRSSEATFGVRASSCNDFRNVFQKYFLCFLSQSRKYIRMKKTYMYFFAMFVSLIRRMKKCFSLKELCLKHQEKHEHALHDIRMLTIGLEPITYKEQILSLSCLPISPSKHRRKYVSLEKTHVSSLQKVYRWGTSSPKALF